MQASVLVCVAACMLAIYLPYQVFIDWWYLRFLLPAWPALAIGTAWLATNTTGRAYGRAGILALVLCGGWGLHTRTDTIHSGSAGANFAMCRPRTPFAR
ncbi:MAG: hypothetical protein IPL75_09020 [Acidobacteria bacterium]|nr:hypothetical protein [Acidobacteriota bacterium]